ncbi:protein kinase domain-containing protein [Microbacterium sp. P5_E9]
MQPLQEAPTTALLGGRYQLGERIGEGGMAHVYRAEDLWLGRTVAVKLIRGDADAVDSPVRARTEMTVLASLDHPALVKLLDGSVDPGQPQYLVMEFVDGTNLAERINDGPLAPDLVAHLTVQLASALHSVHGAGIVHRDLKPSNVLVESSTAPGEQPHVKLADFGVAYLMDSTRVTTPGTVIGTAAYLAPEQVRGEAIAPPADIYALGLVLLEALTGQRAFPNASGMGAVMARLIDSPHVPEWVGPVWAQLLSRMTATDPALRPTALEVAQAAAGLPTHIRPGSVPTEPAATQPSFLLPAEALPAEPAPPTRRVAAPAGRAVSALRTGRRRGVRTGAVALTASLATAVVLGITASAWPTAVDAATEPTVSRVIVEPLSMDIDSGNAAVEPVADTGPSGADVAPALSTPASDVKTKGADEARKAAESAQREAERAQRDAEKQQRQNERESAKTSHGG